MNLNTTMSFIIPKKLVYFAYEGSSTVPDCEENINWYVMEDEIPMSAEQLEFFDKKWKLNTTFANGNGNNRAIQN
jgi:carbonic anhydrase